MATSPVLQNLQSTCTSSTLSEAKVYKDSETARIKLPTRVKDSRSLKPTVEDLTVEAPATTEKIAEKLEVYGACFVRNFLLSDTCDKMLDEVKPYFNKERVWNGEFFPQETTRVCGTMVKSRTAAENLLIHPLVSSVSHKFLGQENLFIFGDKEISTAYSPPQLCACVTFDIAPGAKDQPLHRDDMIHHNIRHYQDKYEYGTETSVLTAIGLAKTSKANGATRFVPGSHLWDQFRIPEEDEVMYAELEKGDGFIMLASCFHGGGANSTKDEHRLQMIMTMTKGTLRQEENIFLETPIEFFKSLSPEALTALGLATSDPFMGWIRDLENPLTILKPEVAITKDDGISETYIIDK